MKSSGIDERCVTQARNVRGDGSVNKYTYGISGGSWKGRGRNGVMGCR